jgi:hypothetical protein
LASDWLASVAASFVQLTMAAAIQSTMRKHAVRLHRLADVKDEILCAFMPLDQGSLSQPR